MWKKESWKSIKQLEQISYMSSLESFSVGLYQNEKLLSTYSKDVLFWK